MAFRLFTKRSRKQDMMLLSGWLFADLLLGLMAIFLAAMPPAPPPTLSADPTVLSLNDTQHCHGTIDTPNCWITLREGAASAGKVNWTPSSDMSDSTTAVKFDPPTGTLSPGQSTTINISNFPCQNGSFTIKGASTNGSRNPEPVVISWQCKVTQVKLEDNPINFNVTISDVPSLLNNPHSPSVVNSIKQQIMQEPQLANRSVGLAIVYGGAGFENPPNTQQGYAIAHAIYDIMRSMRDNSTTFKRASFYNDQYFLGQDPSVATIYIYLYKQ
jgi:hypothetical protein